MTGSLCGGIIGLVFNQLTVSITTNNPAVFYRLAHPTYY